MEQEVDVDAVMQQRQGPRGVGVQLLVPRRLQVGLAQERDARRQVWLPLQVPLLHVGGRLAGADGGHGVGDAPAHRRHEPDQQGHQPGRGCRPVLAAQRHQPGVLPAADLGQLEGLGQEPELGEHPPHGPVAGLADSHR